jgi:ankyrin repeat protein
MSVNINAKDSIGGTALMSACRVGDLSTVKSLVEKGANVNNANNSGYTPLIHASSKGHLEIVKYLVENPKQKADVDAKTTAGGTALSLAKIMGHTEVVKYLESLKKVDTPKPNTPVDMKNAKLAEKPSRSLNSQNFGVNILEKTNDKQFKFKVGKPSGNSSKEGELIAHYEETNGNPNTKDYKVFKAKPSKSQSGGKKTRKYRNKSRKYRNKSRKHKSR